MKIRTTLLAGVSAAVFLSVPALAQDENSADVTAAAEPAPFVLVAPALPAATS